MKSSKQFLTPKPLILAALVATTGMAGAETIRSLTAVVCPSRTYITTTNRTKVIGQILPMVRGANVAWMETKDLATPVVWQISEDGGPWRSLLTIVTNIVCIQVHSSPKTNVLYRFHQSVN